MSGRASGSSMGGKSDGSGGSRVTAALRSLRVGLFGALFVMSKKIQSNRHDLGKGHF